MGAIPRHVAIVMDGNGRWAERRGRPRAYGHVRGSARVREITQVASECGVQALTLYAFSSENWKRPESERAILWRLLVKHLRRERRELMRQNVQLRVIGELHRLPTFVQEEVREVVAALSQNTGLRLNFAVSYGARQELAFATQQIAHAVKSGQIQPESIDEALIGTHLSTAFLTDCSDVDLFLRTSGEQRLSNFLLWQSAYAELLFVEECWPDFTAARFRDVIESYGKRARRFGGLDSGGA
jgi:undecaprenyl diphosphate synthase